MDAPKIVTQEEVISRISVDIAEVTASIEELLPQLGHSEAKRLFLASTKYPLEHSEMAGESDAFKRAYGYSKNVKDALVALGVEVVIEQMLRQQQEANNSAPVVEYTPEQIANTEAAIAYAAEMDAKEALRDADFEALKEEKLKAAPKKRAKKEKA